MWGGEVARFEVGRVFAGGAGEEPCVGKGLFVGGASKFLSSFKDKTFIFFLSEEVFILGKEGETGRGSIRWIGPSSVATASPFDCSRG